MIAKLYPYGFKKTLLRPIYSYLITCIKNSKIKIKIKNLYSLWSLIKYGMPQGSSLCPTLSKIFLYDMFFMIAAVDIANYADDNNSSSVRKIHCELQKILQKHQSKFLNGSVKMAWKLT